jgi:hypothetical protein
MCGILRSFKVRKAVDLGVQKMHHLLKGSLNPHVRGSVKVKVKQLNLHFLIILSFWDNWWFNNRFFVKLLF